MLQFLYLQNSTQSPLNRRLGEAQGKSGWLWRRDVLPVPGFEAWTIQHVANHDNDYTLPQLSAKLPYMK